MTQTEIVLRAATRADIAGMHRVRVAVRENRLSDPNRISAEDYRAAIEDLGRGWVVEHAGQIVGFAIAYCDGEIWALFIDPEQEGRGFGQRLHAQMMGWLSSQSLSQARLGTAVGTRAHKFYLRMGWRESQLKADSDEIILLWGFDS